MKFIKGDTAVIRRSRGPRGALIYGGSSPEGQVVTVDHWSESDKCFYVYWDGRWGRETLYIDPKDLAQEENAIPIYATEIVQIGLGVCTIYYHAKDLEEAKVISEEFVKNKRKDSYGYRISMRLGGAFYNPDVAFATSVKLAE